ncbi:MAG: phosphatase [Planctomycetaceae bacterium]|nr:phosphatase [Planctomycetaceae bacterium]
MVARSLFVPTLGWNMLLGRVLRVRRWWDRVDEHLVLGALPLARDIPSLQEERVAGVINTCEEYAGPVTAYEQAGIEQLRLPTIDFTHPSLDSVQRGVSFIERHAATGNSVYVHCKAGRARSATIAICWLMAFRNLSPADAQQLLIDRRPHVNAKLTSRPVVQEFHALMSRSPQA